MKELRKKTTLTIFSILTMFLIASLTILNVNSYRREYMNIERGLNIFDNRGGYKDAPPGPDAPNNGEWRQKPRELDDMMIMDNEVYTVKYSADGEVENIYSHGNPSDDFEVEKIAVKIRNAVSDPPSGQIVIGNLYSACYSYKIRNDDLIVIVNHAENTAKLKTLLIESILFFLIMEAILFLVSKLITGRIVKPAEEAFKRQKEFIADASHEFKTPLAVIMASADELADNETPDKNDRYIENIRYETDRMSRLIAGLLDLSKLEDAASATLYKDEDLSRIIEKTCLAFDGIAFEQSVAIQTDIEKGLKLKCSKDEIEKMISTILDNAIKHSYKDTTVKVKAALIKNSIIIKVTNAGDAIKEEDRERIFERFYRGDRSRNRSDNRYGLGLAIAKRIALNHNGDIKAYSGGGKTTFEIILKKT